MSRKLKVLDLFAGIGGFALGLDSTGFFETVKFVEMDKYCQKVLRKNFPNIPIEEDIKNVKGKEYEADVITGGFPCQPFSVAGKQKGTNDNRYLWPEMLRLIREIKPEFVIGENVQGLINLQNGVVLRQVQDDLESEGFEVQCFLIPASGIGAWHQRYRVWIVGHSKHNGLLAAEKRIRDKKINVSNTEVIGTREPRNINQEKRNESSSSTQSNSSSEDVSNTISSLRGGRRTIGQSGEDKVWRFYPEKKEQTEYDIWSQIVGRNVISGEADPLFPECERFEKLDISKEPEGQTLSSRRHDENETNKTWWQIESELCGVPNGISYELDKDRANRIKTLGNAIVPQIAREIGLAIKKVLNS